MKSIKIGTTCEYTNGFGEKETFVVHSITEVETDEGEKLTLLNKTYVYPSSSILLKDCEQ